MSAEPSRTRFLREATPQRGVENPTRMRVLTWEWMVRSGESAFRARRHFGADDLDPVPTWSFDRFGRSCTRLADARIVFIGGEHEDFYDPDFFIYNDVTVLTPKDGDSKCDFASCGIEIFGYPAEAFPPTDSHSATLVGDEIVVIGSLGYAGTRREGSTPVRILDTHTWTFRDLPTHGAAPGWIHKHAARYEPSTHSILLGHGLVEIGGEHVANAESFRLHLGDRRWERVAPRAIRRTTKFGGEGYASVAAAIDRLAFPTVQLDRSDSSANRWCIFADDGAIAIVDDYDQLAVEPDEAHPGIQQVLSRLFGLLTEQAGAPWAARDWRDDTRT
jgi:hypothetical protein